MKNDLAKLAVVGLMASFCLSASSPTSGKEIAMSKCSKDRQSQSSSCNNSSCNNKSNSSCSGSSSSCSSNSSSCSGEDESSCNCESSDNTLLQEKREKVSEKVAKAD